MFLPIKYPGVCGWEWGLGWKHKWQGVGNEVFRDWEAQGVRIRDAVEAGMENEKSGKNQG